MPSRSLRTTCYLAATSPSSPPDKLNFLGLAAQTFNLDFDDAYQYATAEHFDLAIVSFDADFDRTDRGRLTPSAAMTK